MIIVVGRGPSLKGRGLGTWIDSFDIVIRLVTPTRKSYGYVKLAEEDYGSKCNYIVTTTGPQFYWLERYDLSQVECVWIYKTKIIKEAVGNSSEILPQMLGRFGYSGFCYFIDDKDSLKWYRENYNPKKLIGNVDYPSKGTMAIITAMKYFEDDIMAAGFDNVLLGERSKEGMMADGFRHDWRAENALLKKVSRESGTKLFALQG